MRPVFSVLMLVAAADALAFQLRTSDKNIQRLEHDEPIPEGWRVATVDDAQRNEACFSLVLRPQTLFRNRDKASLAGDFTVAASNSGDLFSCSPLRIEKRKPPPERCTCKVVVRIDEGEVLKRERVEHAVSRVRKLCEYYLWIYLTVSIIPSFSFKGVFFNIFLVVIYVYMPNVLRSEWIRRRGFI